MPRLRTGLPLIGAAAAILAYATAACSPPSSAERARAAIEAGANHVRLPTVDAAAIFDALSMDDTLEVVSFEPVGATSVNGEVSGYRTKVWAVPVAAGQTLRIDFEPADANLYMNVVDSADMSGAAVHRGEIEGPSARLTPSQDTVYLIEPFQPRATTRRGEGGDYSIALARG